MKRFKDFVTGFLVCAILLTGVAYATGTSIEVSFVPLKFFFDGVEKQVPEGQQGFIYKGTTYVPLRFMGEALGKNITWEGKTKSIYVGKSPEDTVTYIEESLDRLESQNPKALSKIDITELLKSANSYEIFLSNYPNHTSIDYYSFGGGDADVDDHDIVSYNYDFGSVSFCNNVDNSHKYYLYDIQIENEGIIELNGYEIGDTLAFKEKFKVEQKLSKIYGIEVGFSIDRNDIIHSISFSNHTKFFGSAG